MPDRPKFKNIVFTDDHPVPLTQGGNAQPGLVVGATELRPGDPHPNAIPPKKYSEGRNASPGPSVPLTATDLKEMGYRPVSIDRIVRDATARIAAAKDRQ